MTGYSHILFAAVIFREGSGAGDREQPRAAEPGVRAGARHPGHRAAAELLHLHLTRRLARRRRQ